MPSTCQVTTAQATIKFLKNQNVKRDGLERQFVAGSFGIFNHTNVAGIGQALQHNQAFPYYLSRKERVMLHTAVAFLKMNNRLRTFARPSSIGLRATNMLKGVATATLNYIPVLLLLGDIFAGRNLAPDARHFRRLAIEQNQKLGHGFCAANAFFALALSSLLLK